MAEQILTAEERGKLGTRQSRKLRKEGWIPCVLNSKKDQPVHLNLKRKEFETAVKRGERILDLKHPGGNDKVFLKEVQYDHLGEKVYHVSFNKIAMDEEISLKVPVVLKGKPVGVSDEGGTLDQFRKELEIRCLPTKIPKELTADVAAMKLNDRLALKDLKAPEGVKIVGDPELVIASVTIHVVEETTTAAAAEPGTTEPEVIKKEPKPGEEEEEAEAKPKDEKKAKEEKKA